MPLLTVEYHFAASEEFWLPDPGHAQVNMAWFPPHKSRGVLRSHSSHYNQSFAPLSTMGGSIRTTARANALATTSRWTLNARWIDLGVPSGAIVSRVKADYIWRYDLKSHKLSASSDGTWGSNALGSGPFKLQDNSGTDIGTFSELDYAPARASGGLRAWPVGSGANGISFTPASWKLVSGVGVSVPVAQRPASTRVNFQLSSKTPATPFSGTPCWVRLKQDYVKIVIEYNTQGNYFEMFQ